MRVTRVPFASLILLHNYTHISYRGVREESILVKKYGESVSYGITEAFRLLGQRIEHHPKWATCLEKEGLLEICGAPGQDACYEWKSAQKYIHTLWHDYVRPNVPMTLESFCRMFTYNGRPVKAKGLRGHHSPPPPFPHRIESALTKEYAPPKYD